MEPYFADPDHAAALKNALVRRLGTPFRKGMAAPGRGYDCWHLLIDVYEEAGLEVGFMRDFQTVGLNWGRLNKRSILLDFLRDHPACRKHLRAVEDGDELMAGDILPIQQQLSCHHLGIASDARTLWHVPRGGRVGPESIEAIKSDCKIPIIYRIHT